MNAKKQWSRPQLIVLARGTPEESVLASCKQIGSTSGAISVTQMGCTGLNGKCGACQDRGQGS